MSGYRRILVAAVLAGTLGGCAMLPEFGEWQPAPAAGRTVRFVVDDVTDVIGDVQSVTAQHVDTLPMLARRYGLGFDEIVGANPGVDVWLPGDGTEIVLPTRFVLPDAPRQGIVINVAARRLFYFPADEPGVVITHPVGIGREDWATPLGSATVTTRLVDPAWYPPASIRAEHAAKGSPLPGVVGPGPDNPLGKHALLLSMPGYLIHGTNKPAGVGMRVSHGCIRLYPEDIAALFPDVAVGTPVRIVDQSVLAGWRGDRLFVQSYHALDGDPVAVADFDAPVEAALARREAPSPRRLSMKLPPRRGVAIAVTQ